MVVDKLKIRYKLLLPSIFVWVLFFMALHFYWFSIYLEDKKQKYIDQQQLAVHTLGDIFYDVKSAKELIGGRDRVEHIRAEHPAWRSLTVYDAADTLIFQSSDGAEKYNDNLINIEFDIVHSGTLIGKMSIVVDSTSFIDSEKHGFNRLEMTLFGVFSISALLLVFLQDRWIGAPIQTLTTAVKKMSQGDMSAELPVGCKDEIGELVFAVRTLSNSLQLTYLAFHDEVAEVVAMAAELTESEERFRTVFKSIVDTLILIDQKGTITSANPAATKMFGYEENELLGHSIEMLMPEYHRQRHSGYMSAYLSGHGSGLVGGTPREASVLLRDGTEIPVDISINSLRIGDQDHFIGVIRDISAYKQVQEKLTAETQLAQNYLNTASVIMMAIDPNGLITLVNKKGCDVLGYTQEQLLGRNWFKTLFEEDVAGELEVEYAQYMQGKSYFPEYFECFVKTERQERIVVVWNSNILRDINSGVVSGLLVSGEDITETRKSQNTRKILQKQLQQAQKMEAVGQLTGGIAHDFNNMLASIMGYSELALLKVDQINDEKLKQYLGQIYASGERARDLVGKMLAFSRGKDSDTPTPLHLNTVLEELMPMLRSVIPTTVQMDTQLENNLMPVLVDTIDVQQIVMNLCINARDAMDGQGCIVIRTRKLSQCGIACASCHTPIAGEYIELIVEDSGIGIPKETVSRLFEPFYSTKEVGKGTGLGLSVIHGVVHARDGHILVDSREGEGSRFHILFKAVVQSPEETGLGNAAQISRDCGNANHGKTILLVTDDLTCADFVGELLRVSGYGVHTENDPKVALAGLVKKPNQFDLVIFEHNIARMSGIELAENLHSFRADLPVILFSGYGDMANYEAVGAVGISAVFSKPLNTAALLRVIDSIFHKHPGVSKQAASA